MFLLLIFFLHSTSTKKEQPQHIIVDQNFHIKWSVDYLKAKINIILTFSQSEQLGLIFSQNVIDSDAILLQTQNNQMIALDCYFKRNGGLTLDVQQDVNLLSYDISNHTFIASIERNLNTHDPFDQILLIGNNYQFSYFNGVDYNQRHTFNITIGNRNGFAGLAFKDTDLEYIQVIDQYLTLKWRIINSNKTLEMAVIQNRISWIGLGLKDIMSASDMIIIEIVSNKITVSDYFCAQGSKTPTIDTKNSITLVSQQLTNTSMAVRFKRKLNTGDTKDVILKLGPVYRFSYATTPGQLKMIKHTYLKIFKINLTESGSLDVPEEDEATEETIATTYQPTFNSLILEFILIYICL